MGSVYPVVDSHCHTAVRSVKDFTDLAAAGIVPVGLAFWPLEPRSADTLLDNFDRMLDQLAGPIKETGVTGYVGLGIHPKNSHFTETPNQRKVLAALPDYLSRDYVACMGEVGLDTLDITEERILYAQLEIARDAGKPVVIHTPGKRKQDALDRTIDILGQVKMPPNLVVLDHITPELVSKALSFGGKVGLTVKEGKLGADDAIAILRANESDVDRFLINSDFGYSASTAGELTVVRATADRIEEQLGVAAKVCRDNAAQLFGIPVHEKVRRPPRLKA
ncbi:MAG: TatD family hydrolase [Candidatus Altiarchaeota archaeon]